MYSIRPHSRRAGDRATQCRRGLSLQNAEIIDEKSSAIGAAQIINALQVRLPEDPPRLEYRLTEKGKSLGPVVKALRDWGRRFA